MRTKVFFLCFNILISQSWTGCSPEATTPPPPPISGKADYGDPSMWNFDKSVHVFGPIVYGETKQQALPYRECLGPYQPCRSFKFAGYEFEGTAGDFLEVSAQATPGKTGIKIWIIDGKQKIIAKKSNSTLVSSSERLRVNLPKNGLYHVLFDTETKSFTSDPVKVTLRKLSQNCVDDDSCGGVVGWEKPLAHPVTPKALYVTKNGTQIIAHLPGGEWMQKQPLIPCPSGNNDCFRPCPKEAVWFWEQGKNEATGGYEGPYENIDFSEDGKLVALSYQASFIVIDSSNGTSITNGWLKPDFFNPEVTLHVKLSLDGTRLAALDIRSGELAIYQLTDPFEYYHHLFLASEFLSGWSMSWGPNNGHLAVAATGAYGHSRLAMLQVTDQTVKTVWKKDYGAGNDKRFGVVAFDPQGKYLLVGSDGYVERKVWAMYNHIIDDPTGAPQLYEPATGNVLKTLGPPAVVHRAGWSDDGKRFYVQADGETLIWDREDEFPRFRFPDSGHLALGPSGDWIAFNDILHTVVVRNLP